LKGLMTGPVFQDFMGEGYMHINSAYFVMRNGSRL
jgi:hypothetical protein